MIFNQRIGGAGGASASIFVSGNELQSTDTVYAEKGINRANGVWNSQRNGFEISPIEEYGDWNVTVIHNGYAKVIGVTVDAADEFEIAVSFSSTVTLSGTFDSSYGYVMIGGTKYTSAGSYTVPMGEQVHITVSSSSSSQRSNCQVTLDGRTVMDGSGTYDYTVGFSDCTIHFNQSRTSSWASYYWTADITEN